MSSSQDRLNDHGADTSESSIQSQQKELAQMFKEFLAQPEFHSNPPVRVPLGSITERFNRLINLTLPTFLAPFVPPPSDWHDDLVDFIANILELLERGLIRLDSIFLDDKSRALFWATHLISFLRSVVQWEDAFWLDGVTPRSKSITPSDLVHRATAVVVSILETFFPEKKSDPEASDYYDDTKRLMRTLISELEAPSTGTFPCEFELKITVPLPDRPALEKIPIAPTRKIRVISHVECLGLSAVLNRILSGVGANESASGHSMSAQQIHQLESSSTLLSRLTENLPWRIGRPDPQSTFACVRCIQSIEQTLKSCPRLPAVIPASALSRFSLAIQAKSTAIFSPAQLDTALRSCVQCLSASDMSTVGTKLIKTSEDQNRVSPANPFLDLLNQHHGEVTDTTISHAGIAGPAKQNGAGPDQPRRTSTKRKRDDNWRETCRSLITLSAAEGQKPNDRLIDVMSDQECFVSAWKAIEKSLDRIKQGGKTARLEECAPLIVEFLRPLMADSVSVNWHETVTALPLLPKFTAACARALAREAGSVTRRQFIIAMCGVLKLSKGLASVPKDTGGVIQLALEDPERAVRVAGVTLCKTYRTMLVSEKPGVEVLKDIFAVVNTVLQSGSDSCRETAMSAALELGKAPDPDVLGQVVQAMVSQWAGANPLLSSLAYIHLRTLAKQRDQLPYAFLSPYLPQLLRYATANILDSPRVLEHLAKFFSRTPVDILSYTMEHYLPSLVCMCSQSEIEHISAMLKQPIPALLVDHCKVILAEIFLMKDEEDSERALEFLEGQLGPLRARKANLNTRAALVQSCIGDLLAELVMKLGDHRSYGTKRVTGAMARALSMANSKKVPASDLSEDLKPHMLGVMSQLNDVLQGVSGKKTITFKQNVLKSIDALISQLGVSINSVAPQIMAALQSMLLNEGLAEDTLRTWQSFITKLPFRDIGPYIGLTVSSFVSAWPDLSAPCRKIGLRTMEYLIKDHFDNIKPFISEIVPLDSVPEFDQMRRKIDLLLSNYMAKDRIEMILQRCRSDNNGVALLSIRELKKYLVREAALIRTMASGDMFESLIGSLVEALMYVACRDGDTFAEHRIIAYECIGVIGALDPDRLEHYAESQSMIVLHNFVQEEESKNFALHMIVSLLVGAFRSTSDLSNQRNLAFAIQELLKFCGFTSDLVRSKSSGSIPISVRKLWKTLPNHVLDTVSPLLESKFTRESTTSVRAIYPLYPKALSYREWIQQWTSDLIAQTSRESTRDLFSSFAPTIHGRDTDIARRLIPHLVLHVLISGSEQEKRHICGEISTVLKAQASNTSDDRRLWSAQAVFAILDHISSWSRLAKKKRARDLALARKNARGSNVARLPEDVLDIQLASVDSIISSIDQDLLATAAIQSKAYARALMTIEQVILSRPSLRSDSNRLQAYLEEMHVIYANLDEPDAMQGISTKIIHPSLEHQIREHESLGQWTSAQSCWEVLLQQAPDQADLHVGLLRCLQNLGHYDTLLNHVKGILTQHPEWKGPISPMHMEASWMIGDWMAVDMLLRDMPHHGLEFALGNLFLALKTKNNQSIVSALHEARAIVGGPVTSGGLRSYRKSYDSVVGLHVLHEIEVIYAMDVKFSAKSSGSLSSNFTNQLDRALGERLERTQPSFKCRTPILTSRRVGLELVSTASPSVSKEIGNSWLALAKLARKSGYSQTAYSATLQAQLRNVPSAFMEKCRLMHQNGDAIKAFQELTHSINSENIAIVPQGDSIQEAQAKRLLAKAKLLRARWMYDGSRHDSNTVATAFIEAMETFPDLESPHYHFGHFHDRFVRHAKEGRKASKPIRSEYTMCKQYLTALSFGSKHVYEMMPRVLTVWLDNCEAVKQTQSRNFEQGSSSSRSRTESIATSKADSEQPPRLAEYVPKFNEIIEKYRKELQVYQWMTAFPQLLARLNHKHEETVKILKSIISMVLREYTQQALWYFSAVTHSSQEVRVARGREILNTIQGKGNNADSRCTRLVNNWRPLTLELLEMCDLEIKTKAELLSLSDTFPSLKKLCPSPLMLPLQEFLTIHLPPLSSAGSEHQLFRTNAPTFHAWHDEIQIMSSLVKPRKFSVFDERGNLYSFLSKPKDDMRKDARLMDFFSMINKFLKADSEARRRQLKIRTYAVIPLNETSGLIEWVPNTVGFRQIVSQLWEARGILFYKPEHARLLDEARQKGIGEAAKVFSEKIMPAYPVVFHEWFLANFPEPSAWFACRLAYGRTTAVMSMVGTILGLGDRHGENILFDANTGETQHVDFNCIFEKGKLLDVKELVPFRLTPNIIDGFGVMGIEGVFRNACEISMRILRNHKDSLMSVLEAFVHDPLIEFEAHKKKQERGVRLGKIKDSRAVTEETEEAHRQAVRELAQKALEPIGHKLRGHYQSTSFLPPRVEREQSVSNFVELLIQEASDAGNLGSMYPGWAAWL